MYYISRTDLINNILGEAVLMGDDEPTRRVRSVKGSGDQITNIWGKAPFEQIKSDTGARLKGGKGGGKYGQYISTNRNKLIISRPPLDTCLNVMANAENPNVEHENEAADGQNCQNGVYWQILYDFGLVDKSPTLSKKTAYYNHDVKAINKALNRIDAMYRIRKKTWLDDEPAEKMATEIKEDDTLRAIFIIDPEVGPVFNAALKNNSIHTIGHLKKFINDALENNKNKMSKEYRYHTITFLENVAARSIKMIDNRMRKAGYKDGIMNVQDMFEYLETTQPARYKNILSTYDLTPEIIAGFKDYYDLNQWLYKPEMILKIYDIVSNGGLRHVKVFNGLLAKRTSLADKGRIMRKKIQRGENAVAREAARGSSIPAMGTPERVEYEAEKYQAKRAAFEELIAKYKALKETDRAAAEEYKNSKEFKVAHNLSRNAQTSKRKAEEALAAAESGTGNVKMSKSDSLRDKKKTYTDYLTAKRGHIPPEMVAAFDLAYNYPKLMRDSKPGLPADFLSDMYEFSFSIVRDDYEPFGDEIIEFVDSHVNEYINAQEVEAGYEGTVLATIIPLEEEMNHGLHTEKIEVLRIIFDYPKKSHLYSLLGGDESKAKNAAINIMYDIMGDIEEKFDVYPKPYIEEGHGTAINEPSSNLIGL